MTRPALFATAVLFLTAVALCLRLPNLNNRPFHGDEAVHAFKFRELWEHGTYKYDPNEFHGPTIYYAALPAVALSGHHQFGDTEESDYRLAVALFGAAMIPLLWLLKDAIGRGGVLWAGLLAALSPAFVFYSRYFIQEILLAFFTLGLLACYWRYQRSGKIGWLVGSGISAGMMIASKETAPLAFFAFAAAWFLTRNTQTPREAVEGEIEKRPKSWQPLLIGSAVALVVAYLFLSGFFSNLLGPFGYLQSYTPWLKRAGGTNLHQQSFAYYLKMLAWHHPAAGPVWSEGLILILAVIGAMAVFGKRLPLPECADRGFIRFTAVFTLLLTIIYSAIPYKTPWCLLSFLIGMILLAGVGASVVVKMAKAVPLKAVFAVGILAASAQLGWQAYRTSFVFYTDLRNPYVYAQPVPDALEFKKRADELALFSPQKFKMVIKVISVDNYYWPLPWYLRRFDNVGYYTEVPPDPDASIVFVSPKFDEPVTQRLEKTHLMTGFYGLRPTVVFETFVRMELWEPYVTKLNADKKKNEPEPDYSKWEK